MFRNNFSYLLNWLWVNLYILIVITFYFLLFTYLSFCKVSSICEVPDVEKEGHISVSTVIIYFKSSWAWSEMVRSILSLCSSITRIKFQIPIPQLAKNIIILDLRPISYQTPKLKHWGIYYTVYTNDDPTLRIIIWHWGLSSEIRDYRPWGGI